MCTSREGAAKTLDELDKAILTVLQRDFPICAAPYRHLADRFGLSEEALISRIRRMKACGVIRRIGAVFDLKKLGYASTLVAAKTPKERVEEVAAVINAYPGVTHNYERDGALNLWFTLIAPSDAEIARTMEELKEKTGVREMRSMPATRTFKIQVDFKLVRS